MIVKNPDMYVVTGTRRSGTTLLQAIFNAHPDVCSPPESHFFREYIVSGKWERLFKRGGIRAVVDNLRRNEDFGRLHIDAEEIAGMCRENNIDITAGNFFMMSLSLFANTMGKKKIAEKDPFYIECLPFVEKVFPDAYIIHIIRDPRDVVLSLKKVKWANADVAQHSYYYRERVPPARRFGEENFGAKYVEIFYEDLLRHPEREIKRLCGRLGLDFREEMLKFHEHSDRIYVPGEVEWKNNIRRPIMSDNLGKWRTELTEGEVYKVETVCKRCFDELPYELSGHSRRLGGAYRSWLTAQIFFMYLKKAVWKIVDKAQHGRKHE